MKKIIVLFIVIIMLFVGSGCSSAAISANGNVNNNNKEAGFSAIVCCGSICGGTVRYASSNSPTYDMQGNLIPTIDVILNKLSGQIISIDTISLDGMHCHYIIVFKGEFKND